MGGMGGGSGVDDPVVVAAFHRALLRGGLVVAVLIGAFAVVWVMCRSAQARRAGSEQSSPPDGREGGAEPSGRRTVRIGFGLLWIFDGILQGQASMPLGMIPRVVKPAAAGSPGWVRQLVDSGTAVWADHPVTAAASAVWIQVGIGLFLLVASRGAWSRLAGMGSVVWALIVWAFGEAFGGIFAPAVTWLFGAPGAALFYAAAGVLVALPESSWSAPRLGRWTLRAMGSFFAAMAVLQAWPGRGFWSGGSPAGGDAGSLVAMTHDMAQTPQPAPVRAAVSAFSGFDAAHGWAVNLFAVIALAGIGLGLLAPRRPVVRAGLVAALVLCLADWVLVEDLGFVGGTGTDPNTMVPMALLLGGGYLAWTRLPATTRAPVSTIGGLRWRQRLLAEPVYTLRVSAAVVALGVTLVGAVPMAVAAASAGPVCPHPAGSAGCGEAAANTRSANRRIPSIASLDRLQGRTIRRVTPASA